jgi:Lrp/AsnC family leucine-responsive transcriptional regulator
MACPCDSANKDRATAFEQAVVAMPEIIACHMVSGEADYLLEVVVCDLERYQRFLLGKLLDRSIVKEVRSSIAIQTLKTAALLPLDYFLQPQRGQQPDGGAFQTTTTNHATGKMRR